MSFPRWQLFQRYHIPDSKDPTQIYLTRWRLLQTPWFGIYLHKIYLPDGDRHLHDHPWSFLSLVLWGGYDEEVPGPFCTPVGFSRPVPRRVRWWNWKPATGLHRVRRLHRSPTWTLLFVGPKRRTWGFMTEDGWVRHKDYFERRGIYETLVEAGMSKDSSRK